MNECVYFKSVLNANIIFQVSKRQISELYQALNEFIEHIGTYIIHASYYLTDIDV